MSKTIPVATYHAAKAKADAGDTHGAWQVLADAGDNYARAGAAIMDPTGDSLTKARPEKYSPKRLTTEISALLSAQSV